jgi:hypothetical protein
MFYPGEDNVYPVETRAYPGPVSSIRMKMYRRGVQDYEYFWMAEQSGYATEVDALLAEALPHVMWESVSVPDWSNANADYETIRRELADMLARTPRFGDVGFDHWAYTPIMACVDNGVVKGYPDNLYRPAARVLRDQMAVFIARALAGGDDAVPPGPAEPSFSDVPTDNWAYDHIEYAVSNNVVEGYEDGTYHPEWVVQRDQMAVFIARSIVTPTGDEGLADYLPPTEPTFPDVPTDQWAYKCIEYLAGEGVVAGYDDGLYRPDREVTRDQMAVYIARAFGFI